MQTLIGCDSLEGGEATSYKSIFDNIQFFFKKKGQRRRPKGM